MDCDENTENILTSSDIDEEIVEERDESEKNSDLSNFEKSQKNEREEPPPDTNQKQNFTTDKIDNHNTTTANADAEKNILSSKSKNTNSAELDDVSGCMDEKPVSSSESIPTQNSVHQNNQQIDNQNVNNQTIAQTINNYHHKYYHKIESQISTETTSDPTIPLPRKPSQLPCFQADDQVEKYVEYLVKESVLVSSCHDEAILQAAAYSLIETPALESFEKRMLVFEGKNQNKNDISLETFTQTKIGQGFNVVIVIDVKSSLFLDSLFANLLFVESTKNILKEKEILLFCLVNNTLLQDYSKNRLETFNFCHWDIPFLRHVLSQNYRDDVITEMETKILELRGVGLWGEYNNDIDFYNYVLGYIRENGRQFSDMVRRWYKDSKEMDRNEFLKSVKVVEPDTLFKYDNKIISSVLYIATFFPELTLPQFNVLVDVLLSGLKERKEIESIEETENGEKKIVKFVEEKTLLEAWREKSDQILKECYLYADSENRLIVEFSYPYLRKELVSFLTRYYPNFLYQQFEKIHHSGIFFQQQVPERIVNRIANLSVKMTLLDQDSFGSDWLLNIVQCIDKQIKLDLSNKTQGDYSDFIAFIASEVETNIRNPFYSRLSELIREMLNHSELVGTVRSFFEKMIGASHHDAALIITLEISKRLKNTPQFENLYWMWMKRILDQGHKDIKEKAYFALQNSAIQAGSRVYQYIDNISLWLPESEDSNKYSPSNAYALRFLLDYCVSSVIKFNMNGQGDKKFAYPLFMALNGNEQSSKRIERIVKWLFNPALGLVLPNILPDIFGESEIKELLLHYVLADLVEEWYLILSEEDIGSKDNYNLIADKIIYYIVRNTSKDRHRLLLERWQSKRGMYLNEMSQISSAEKNNKSVLARKRKNIINIEKNFKQNVRNYN